jgi:hypothetical protein
MNLQSSDTVEMAVLLAVTVHNIGHPHLRTSTPYASEICDGIEAEKEVVMKYPHGVWGFCSVFAPIF